jgi:hypothetical protein
MDPTIQIIEADKPGKIPGLKLPLETIGEPWMAKSKKKQQSFGGIRMGKISPPVAVGEDAERDEAKMYNFKLNFNSVLRLKHSLDEAARYLSQYYESSDAHRKGVRLVINFESGRIDFQKP